MTPKDEAGYRLALADGRLASAERSLADRRWADSALFARAAVENAAKAVLACFQSVPRTHEPDEILEAALAEAGFPARLAERAREMLPALEAYGLERHLELSYGDEQNLLTPEAIVTEEDALQAVADARAVLELAREVRAALSGG